MSCIEINKLKKKPTKESNLIDLKEDNDHNRMLPRANKTINDNEYMGSEIINIYFEMTTGVKVILSVPNRIPLKELIKMFARKINLSESYIGTKVLFLFNGRKLDHESLEDIQKVGIRNNFNITVFDNGNVIGKL